MPDGFILMLEVVVGGLILGLVMFLIAHFYKRRKWYFDQTLLLVQIPKESEEENQNQAAKMVEGINKTEQLFASLLSLQKPFTFEVAVPHVGEDIHFYVSVPKDLADFVSRQIQGFFPDAQVHESADYNIFAFNGASSCAYLTLRDSFILPVRSYRESEIDTFSPIVSTLSKLQHTGEGAALQYVVMPAMSKGTKKHIVDSISDLKKGQKFSKVLKRSFITGKEVAKIFGLGGKSGGPDEAKIVDEEAVKALTMKAERPLFSVNVRLVASAQDKDRAEDILLSMAGSFSQFAAPIRNQFLIVKPRNPKRTYFEYSFRVFDPDQAMVLNTAELASIYHLPVGTTDVPRIKWLKTREAPPPPNLPDEGTIIGESIFRGETKPVRMTDADRRRHLYVIGQTGTGKSWFMQAAIRQDMKNGKGICVIDPHGELANDVLAAVPPERIDDVIVFDPGDLKRPLGLNMIEYDLTRPEEKTFIVNEIQSIFNQLFSNTPEGLGPVFQQYMRNSLLLLMEDMKNEPATLVELPRIFTDDSFRKRKLARITNPSVIDFWEKEATKTTGESSLANITPYITTKFGNFISNDYVRPIIGQTKSAFNFRTLMDESKILVVNLSKGKIGDINANLLGMILTGKILMAALSREDMDPKDRKDFYLYIDEFQNYTTESIATILSEARKYLLCLTLAHQYIGQLKENIRDAVFGNVGSMVALRVGVPDTEFLAKEFSPQFSAKDMISQENQRAIVKLLINGHPAKPFNMKALFLERGSYELVDKVKELSRLKYGVDLNTIEREILLRLRM